MTDISKPLAGRVAIVTGSGRNIGRAIAIAFATAGARVVINGHRDRAALDAVVEEIRRRGGEAIACLADVSRDEDIARMVALAKEAYGHVDIAVSNVGKRPYAAFLDITPQDWDDVLRTNLSAAFYLARHVIPMMRERRFGRIINISGFSGFFAHVTHRAHSVSAKFGMHGLSKAIAREFGPDGITANTVAPGMIDTERDWSQYKHIDAEKLVAEIPVRRAGLPQDIAEACLFLAGESGGFVSGQVLHVNGGQMMI
ncbi:MAG: SDR family NAD(P)-dependent oxidoreductase [Pseudomonadota bacterium]